MTVIKAIFNLAATTGYVVAGVKVYAQWAASQPLDGWLTLLAIAAIGATTFRCLGDLIENRW